MDSDKRKTGSLASTGLDDMPMSVADQDKSAGMLAEPHALEQARRLYRQRRDRAQYFDMDLFGEPAWDMLLALYIARGEGRTMCTKSVCKSAPVPAPTALRALYKLEDDGFVGRHTPPGGSVALVEISQTGFDRLTALLEGKPPSLP